MGMSRESLRTCIVEMPENLSAKSVHCGIEKPRRQVGYFHLWCCESEDAYIIGASRASTLYGIVEYDDGTVHRVPPEYITFTDIGQ